MRNLQHPILSRSISLRRNKIISFTCSSSWNATHKVGYVTIIDRYSLVVQVSPKPRVRFRSSVLRLCWRPFYLYSWWKLRHNTSCIDRCVLIWGINKALAVYFHRRIAVLVLNWAPAIFFRTKTACCAYFTGAVCSTQPVLSGLLITYSYSLSNLQS